MRISSLNAVLACNALLSGVGASSRARERRALELRQSYTGGYNGTTGNATSVALHVNTKDTFSRNTTAPFLYGIMFEDINHSGDGGIYAELLANRAFQGSNVIVGSVDGYDGSLIKSSENPILPFGPVITGWGPIGNVRMSLDKLHPLSDALPVGLQIDIPEDATGEVGFENFGWWGIPVTPQTYKASFYVLANAARYDGEAIDFTVTLKSNLTDEVFVSSKISSQVLPTVDHVQLNATIDNTVTAPNSNNSFAITMPAEQVAGKTLYFSLISLFPETFKGRENGLRKDLAEAFYDMKPKFLRFPGGNNLEGVSVQTRWNWRKTIGPLKDRPGRPADWLYYNTDGLGLLEYLYWCEDMEIEPVLAIYAGFSLDIWGQKGTSYPPERMDEILQDALDELEYIMGSTDTKYGALRASHGREEPFSIKFIEVGNEDWFSTTYPYRWKALYDGLTAAHPNITLISTAYNENANYTIELPPGTMWDTHHYEEPQYFLKNFNFYDNWQVNTSNEDVGVLLGEYSVFQVDTPSGAINWSLPADIHVAYPRLVSAIAEGIYALGGERNPNTVKMSSYAPSLMNQNWYNWTPNMITFVADHAQTILSASYWQQWVFARYRGTHSIPVTNSEGDFNPLFWAAALDENKNELYLKVINAGNSSVPLTVDIDTEFQSVNGTIITNTDVNAYNTVENQNAVVPRPLNSTGSISNGNWKWQVPAYSITVLQFNL